MTMNIKQIRNTVLLLLIFSANLFAADYELIEGNLYKTVDGDKHHIKEGLPQKNIYPFEKTETRRLTGLAVVDSSELYVSTPYRLLHSDDGGASWKTVVRREKFARYAYITSLAADKSGSIALGTSFHGLFLSRDGGKIWNDISENISFLDAGAGYYDDISRLAFLSSGKLVLSARLGSGLYSLDLESGGYRDLEWPAEALIRKLDSSYGRLYISTDEAEYLFTGKPAEDKKYRESVYGMSGFIPVKSIERDEQLSKAAESRKERASGKQGLYLSAWQAHKNLDDHISFAKENGLNAFVIDFKDDLGRVTYDSSVTEVKDAGAHYALLDSGKLIKEIHEAGLYLIARVVVFKDPEFYYYKNSRYALWDETRDAPWGYFHEVENKETGETELEQREFWVDPYSEAVWDYNISIAEELEAMGVDEIQFDYIRFPSDGPVQNITFRNRRENMRKPDALESFLKKSREKISIPVSTDVFGFNGWYEMDYLGQNIRTFSKYVDVICPMLYPSHFQRDFLYKKDYNARAEDIYYKGTWRASAITAGNSLIRPYIQAFLIFNELRMEEPEYTDYLHKQLEGNLRGGGDGYLLWNASGRYYMVQKNLSEYNTN